MTQGPLRYWRASYRAQHAHRGLGRGFFVIIPLLLVLEFVVLVAAVGWLARGRLAGMSGSWRAWRPDTELVLLAGLTASAPLAVELAPVPVRAVLGSCALLLAPGAAVLAFWPVRDVLDRLLLTVVLSAHDRAAAEHGDALDRPLEPGAAGAPGRAGRRPGAGPARAEPHDRGRRRSPCGSGGGDLMSLVTSPTERLAPHTSRIARHPVPVHAAVIAVAAVLWLVSLPLIDPSELSDIGLISVLPPTYFVGLGLLAAGFAWAFTASYRRGVLPAYVLALAVFLHGLAPALYSVPKYAYVYKHVAVIDFIAGAGAVYRNIDIYHNWPGFFAACASLSTVLGVDPAQLCQSRAAVLHDRQPAGRPVRRARADQRPPPGRRNHVAVPAGRLARADLPGPAVAGLPVGADRLRSRTALLPPAAQPLPARLQPGPVGRPGPFLPPAGGRPRARGAGRGDRGEPPAHPVLPGRSACW